MERLELTAFICGCGHSGTTLLATILAAHPRIHVPLYESEAFLRSGAEAEASLERLKCEAAAARRTILVEKTPKHVRRIGVIRRMVPRALFILLVRDGRDVTASIAHRNKGDFDGALRRWINDSSVVLQERDSPDTILVRYEDLVADARRTVQRVCGFLGVDYRDDLLEYHRNPRLWYGKTAIQRTTGVGTEHEDLRNWQVNQPMFDGRGRWKRDLPAAVVERFDRGQARELMSAFGYFPRWRRWLPRWPWPRG